MSAHRPTSNPSPAGSVDGRGSRTRALVLDTALRMFREQGFDKTTMRAIATAAGLSPGNAYYYFASKDALIQEFYLEVQQDRLHRAAEVLASSRSLAVRLAGALHAGVDEMTPFHEFASGFIKIAVDPRSPSNPFSAESSAVREMSTQLFREVVHGSSVKLDERMKDQLPELLMLVDLGVTTFWVHDSSPGQRKTRELIDGVTPILARLIAMSRLPVLRSLSGQMLNLVDRLRS